MVWFGWRGMLFSLFFFVFYAISDLFECGLFLRRLPGWERLKKLPQLLPLWHKQHRLYVCILSYVMANGIGGGGV